MGVSGITWKAESFENAEMLREIPAHLVRVLSDTNGFILRGVLSHGKKRVRAVPEGSAWARPYS